MSPAPHFRWPVLVTVIGLTLCYPLGWRFAGGVSGGLSYLAIGAVLAALEISLSFDNAIVNANTLKRMTPVWRRRFLTWGILIAVFGMRVLFPLLVIAVAAGVGPWAAVALAATEPEAYARIMGEAELGVAAFGGAFLMMVALSYFIDHEKQIHWVPAVERRMCEWASIRGLEIGFVVVVALTVSAMLPRGDTPVFLIAAGLGLATFLAVDLLGRWLDCAESAKKSAQIAARQGGLGAFLYLEVLDASFSFDGVVGAFALTSNLFLIAIGLGTGAMYVRAMTIMLVENSSLSRFRYLEHGAFYSILALSLVMFFDTLVHVPELVTGLIGAALIGVALLSSILYNRRNSGA